MYMDISIWILDTSIPIKKKNGPVFFPQIAAVGLVFEHGLNICLSLRQKYGQHSLTPNKWPLIILKDKILLKKLPTRQPLSNRALCDFEAYLEPGNKSSKKKDGKVGPEQKCKH